jgi:hypothetical protein
MKMKINTGININTGIYIINNPDFELEHRCF